MRVQIQIKGLPGAARLRRFTAHKFGAALAHFSYGIEDATIRLNDINGADRGGVDKLCRIVLTLKNSSVVIIEELGSDIARAIERAVDRLQQSVSRQIVRIVEIDRSGIRQNNLLVADV